MLIALIAVMLCLSGCMREESFSPEVVARVDERVLTAGEIAVWEASLGQVEVPQEVRLEYIQRWVEKELIFKAATDNGLEDDPWVVQQLEDVKRSLIVSRFLEIKSRKIPMPSPNEIKRYFQEHVDEFVWSNLHLVVEYWYSNEKAGMDRLRANLVRGNQTGLWSGTAGSLENDRIALDGKNSADPAIWKVVAILKVGQVSQVIFINDNYWVFKLIDRREVGETKGIDDVQDDIVARLLNNSRQKTRDDLVHELIESFRREGRLTWSNPPSTVSVTDTVG